ncbi:MAG: DnaA regulatory inactivator Hda [Gallionellales bacterium RIFOXYB12_FULL_54_9]|nr:MAG: DnaA regulatory inactivator Hda [Gallionellales bacterium RIFOXYB12_FULL_54_9]
MTQLLLDITPDWWPTFDNFVAGGNQELLAVLQAALSGESRERCIYIWGNEGCGKSHLLQASVSAARNAHYDAIYAQGVVPEPADVVAVDDVDVLDELGQVELFNIYNRIRDAGGMLLVSGKASPLHLRVRPDLRTRLGWGLVYQVHALSDEEKAHALTRHAQERGFTLTHEVTQYLLRHGRRDLPGLLAVLDELDAHSLRLHRAPTVPLLKEVFINQMDTSFYGGDESA